MFPENTRKWTLCRLPLQHLNQPAYHMKTGRGQRSGNVTILLITGTFAVILQIYLLVWAQVCSFHRCEAIGQQSSKSKQQTENVQRHENDDLFGMKNKSKKLMIKILTYHQIICLPLCYQPSSEPPLPDTQQLHTVTSSIVRFTSLSSSGALSENIVK